MHTVHHQDLRILLETTRPSSVLLIDTLSQDLPRDSLPPNCQVTHLGHDVLGRLPSLGRFDLGIVAHTVEHLPRRDAGILLARLRDLYTRRFVVLAPIGDDWENQHTHWAGNDFLSYGMTLMSRYRVDGKPLHLYHYAIESYKTTPEWFNNQYWAHPELWKP